jgi:hypothetical protein
MALTIMKSALGKPFFLVLAALLALGTVTSAQAHPDGYWDRGGHWRHYENYHHRRGYWNDGPQGRIFINIG